MKVGIIADSPTLTTGFAVTTDRIARALSARGHEVVCFGLKAYGEIFDRSKYPFRIWTVAIDPGSPWGELMRRFLDFEQPDVLFINMDVFNLAEILGYAARARRSPPTVWFAIFDGLPAYRRFVRPVPDFAQLLVTTEAGIDYVRRCGGERIHLAPPGVDREVFRPLPDVADLRRRAGLDGSFVVGCFGRNCDRKQQPRLLYALDRLVRAGRAGGVHLYFHCNARAYWHLDEIAADLGLADRIFFAGGERAAAFDETAGVAYDAAGPHEPAEPRPRTMTAPAVGFPAEYGYVQRMSCCDLIVNPAHCGDFENVLIEAQACGVPIAATDDGGIMREALGDGGIPLPAADVDRWFAGQWKHHVDVGAIADAIERVRDDSELRAELRRRGFDNAARYPWSRLETAAVRAVEEAGRG